MVASRTVRFDLGRTLATPGAIDELRAAGVTPAAVLARHAAGDWGDLDAEDRAANEAALRDGSRLLSAYQIAGGGRVWVITEAADDAGRRAATTVLLPDEY